MPDLSKRPAFMTDPKRFFDHVRADDALFNAPLTEGQVRGLNRLLSAWEKYGTGDRRHLAYVLATSFHETGRRMEPVREGFASTDAGARAAVQRLYAAGRIRRNYALPAANGNSYYGRGDVQLTHPENYRGPLRDRVLEMFGVDIYAEPDACLRSDVSAFILIEGMTRGLTGRGDYTGKALEDYIGPRGVNFVAARRVVNGTDKAREIAAYAVAFDDALAAAGVPPLAA